MKSLTRGHTARKWCRWDLIPIQVNSHALIAHLLCAGLPATGYSCERIRCAGCNGRPQNSGVSAHLLRGRAAWVLRSLGSLAAFDLEAAWAPTAGKYSATSR